METYIFELSRSNAMLFKRLYLPQDRVPVTYGGDSIGWTSISADGTAHIKLPSEIAGKLQAGEALIFPKSVKTEERIDAGRVVDQELAGLEIVEAG
jgi:hypothetical protein